MIRVLSLLCFVAAVGAAGGLYKVKLEARELAYELSQIEREIARKEEAISLLKAEWSVLNEPSRIQRLAAEHLGLQPIETHQIVRVGSFESSQIQKRSEADQPRSMEDLLAQ